MESLTNVIIGCLALVFVLSIVAAAIKTNKQRKSTETKTPIKAKQILTEHEKTMFGEINIAVPECLIFPQVSFSALLYTKGYATRNRFNRKIADFVITDRWFNVLAIIELDDKSHEGKEQQDAERDAMLKEAGYKVLRYRHMPNKQKLRADILG